MRVCSWKGCFLKTLLELQSIDLEIEACRAREIEIPKQKGNFDIHRKRLATELEERKETSKQLLLEQRTNESEIEQKQAQIDKYDRQLSSVKKNEEYQALLHEMDGLKKQIALKEERIIALMMDLDDASARLKEDEARIDKELKDIERQSTEVEAELAAVAAQRKALEARRAPLEHKVTPKLMSRYLRIKKSKKAGAAVVHISGESCSGCFMAVTPQVVNEVMDPDNTKMHSCPHCGRLLFFKANFENAGQQAE